MADDRWLIAGLGNPGKQYEETRHNVGFQLVMRLAETAGLQGKKETKFNAIVAAGRWKGIPMILCQPLTFMNLSGEAVSKIMQYYQIPPERLIVVYDDAALPFGKLRVRPSGTDGGQKGMRSIISCLGGNKDFPRLRIGIGSPAFSMQDHVLSKFSPDEQQHLPQILNTAMDALEVICKEGVETARNQFNGMMLVPEEPVKEA
jgi:PTH1 family peptidyl-tRNA hydrolase